MLTTVSFKRSIASGLLAVLGALAATTTSHAQVGLFSTGVDDSNTVLATGAVDRLPPQPAKAKAPPCKRSNRRSQPALVSVS